MSEEWDTVTAAVAEHADELKGMTSHGDIYRWAKAHDLTSRTLFPKFKAQLRRRLGIDYEQLRDAATTQRAEQLADAAADAPQIVLWAAGDDDYERFAVCDVEGEALWYSTFHADDRLYRGGDPTSASTSAAEKAVYLAGQARREAGLDTVRLRLRVCDARVDAAVMTSAGVAAGVLVSVEVVEEDNPASEWCRAPGFKNWRESRLAALIGDTEVPR
ncbi:hypothetical protein [Nocardia abscessus]|uniref:hypothetical protein n=1 Tax=Nocardia abscessus TaxID=120957 RepID=UPI002457D33A|nr:hypothetical protein [Nocardia abscessus]